MFMNPPCIALESAVENVSHKKQTLLGNPAPSRAQGFDRPRGGTVGIRGQPPRAASGRDLAGAGTGAPQALLANVAQRGRVPCRSRSEAAVVP